MVSALNARLGDSSTHRCDASSYTRLTPCGSWGRASKRMAGAGPLTVAGVSWCDPGTATIT
jgi:hypothetical protein